MNHCRNCRYYVQPEKEVDQGICHKFPPTVMAFPVQGKISLNPGMPNAVGIQLQSFFPPVNGDNWCGKWSMDEGKEIRN